MFAKLKHLAIVSDQYTLLGKFYETMFGMKPSANARPDSAVVVKDGYVGMNINPRMGKAGRQAGLDHFGFEVQDVELAYARLREQYPSVRVLKRPSNRPFAGISTHDPAGNVFDLSQEGMDNRADAYVTADNKQDRHVNHIALRVVDAERIARFYVDVFELQAMEKPADDPNYAIVDLEFDTVSEAEALLAALHQSWGRAQGQGLIGTPQGKILEVVESTDL